MRTWDARRGPQEFLNFKRWKKEGIGRRWRTILGLFCAARPDPAGIPGSGETQVSEARPGAPGYWPEIEPLCTPHLNPERLKEVLAAVSEQMQGRYYLPATHLLENFAELARFLAGNRFRSDPRQIANALAGVPQISMWRSLKLCQGNPCALPIEGRAIRAYICRKHPLLFRTLTAEYSLPYFIAAMRGYASKDARLREHSASSIHLAWKQAVPNYNSLGLKTGLAAHLSKAAETQG